MSRRGELLDLLHDAAGRYRRLRATIRIWEHQVRAAAAMDLEWSGYGPRPAPTPEEVEHSVELWMELPDKVREESHDASGDERLLVIDGTQWWQWGPRVGALTNGGDPSHQAGVGHRYRPLLEPWAMLAALDLCDVSDAVADGRRVLRARARSRVRPLWASGSLDPRLTAGVSEYADEYLLDVDRELGLLVRFETRKAGLPLQIVEATRLEVNAEHPPGTFVFEPPAGEELRQVQQAAGPRLRPVAVWEAAALAPFQLHVLGELPVGWRLEEVRWQPPNERLGMAAHVLLSYATRDQTAWVSMSQCDPSAAPIYTHGAGNPPFEERVRDGRSVRVRDRSEAWPQTQVELIEQGTYVGLVSNSLDAEAVIGLLQRLVPAPTTPPET